MTGSITLIGVIVIGSVMVSNSDMSAGSVVASMQLFGGISFMFVQLGGFKAQMQRSLVGAVSVFEVLDEKEESASIAGLPRIENDTEDMIRFDDVNFSYGGNPVLKSLSFSVPKGSVVALAGPSGCGKSTILKILLGFYPHSSGNITVNGMELSDDTLGEIRNMFAYVPQDAFLFKGTIEENIKAGNIDSTKDDVVNAAKSANIHEFIMALPEGYNTQVGEFGTALSGGQRQLVSIARAFMKNAPILLLDEATSSLDSESEAEVHSALTNLMMKRTTLVVAHRLSTIEDADIIYVISDGKVAERGRHAELRRASGIYDDLCRSQFFDERQNDDV